ncbi:MAG: glutathione ABC transporter permease GsiC, partial [Dongia sp.]
MAGYLIRRLIHVVLVLIGVSIITFLILHALPHDPARQVAGRTASPEQVEQVRHELGLDQPLPVQYWHFAV